MATYRNSYANYYSDKTGNHSPVGTVLPVFADLNLASQDPEYTYPQHLYCDGKSLLIRDYPELYSIIKNTYGGAAAQNITQPAQPGGLRRSYIINNKLFFQFYWDSTNNKANVKRPYPYGAVFRFSLGTNPYGSFPITGIFNQTTFYQLIQPTEDVTAQAQTNEFAYELVLPDSVDLTTVTQSDYNIVFTTGSNAPTSHVIDVTNTGDTAYVLTGNDRDGSVSGNNPTVTVGVGDIIQFNVNITGHPFLIKTVNSNGTANQLPNYTGSGNGVVGNGAGDATTGVVTLYTSGLSGVTLYYNCQTHAAMNGSIAIGGAGPAIHPDIVVQKSYNLQDYPYNIGTFNLPDYRQRKILGFGNVNGAGTSTPENAINNSVGQIGGQWYIPKDTLINSGDFFVIGDVKTTGYNSIAADISAYITGTVKYQIGPMDDYVFPFPPTHSHRMLTVEVDQTKLAELGTVEVDKFAVNYVTTRANVNLFEPAGSAGQALGHSHGLIGVPLQNSLTATYGNSNGIGDKLGTTGGQQYQYMISEAPQINVLSVTYDSVTDLITVNCDGNHNLSIGDIITINQATPSEFSGNFTIVATGFGLGSFSVGPRDGETPQQATAGGTGITVQLANGYFTETEVVIAPRAYVVDNTTLVGGKQIQFDIPGNSFVISQSTFTTPQGGIISVPDASGGQISGCSITMNAPGGGGADSDNDGQNGGYAEVGITVDGTFYTIRAVGGGGGTSGSGGGSGGSGGSFIIPQALLDDTRFNFNQTLGDAGDNGGIPGTGSNVSLGGGVVGAIPSGAQSTGGNGTAQIKSVSNTDPVTTYTSNGTWTIPSPAAGEISRSISIEISGAGGGAGNANSGSNCSSTWTGWPTTVSGKTGANGGYGGRGARLIGAIAATAGTLEWDLGNGGNAGFNTRQGNTVGGTPGNDPATGLPWDNWPGGIGNGSEPGGITPGVTGATGCLSGAGGQGTWGNGATAGSGGGASGIFLNGVLIAGAGGGGGGGGSGGGYNGSGTTDGCYPGGNAQGATQGLVASAGALDFANGSSGSSGGCTAGGGGGGGSACGVINAASGGIGGQAGVGHNGNGGGTGGTRGISAYRTSYWVGAVSEDELGSLPTVGGYVKIQFSNVTEYYDNTGGGGGQGGNLNLSFGGGIATSVTYTLQAAGNGGGEGLNGGGGTIDVIYFGQEEGTTVPGGTTSPAGRYYECDSDGNPIGSPFIDNVWQSSTDPNINQREFGTGTGSVVGFVGGTAIPYNTQTKIQRYIEFKGAATDSTGKRQLEVGTFNLSQANKMRFTVIRGSNQNGGENPDQALNVFYRKGGSNTVTLFSQILLAANADPLWQTPEITIAEGDAIRDANITLILEQDRGPVYQTAAAADDNYGLGAITLFYDSNTVTQFISTGGATLTGNLDEGGQPINADTGIDQVRREVSAVGAALTVTDGSFTMSSSTPITTVAAVTAENNIPLITKYHRVKYLIKAL
jgi:hypothetical protein